MRFLPLLGIACQPADGPPSEGSPTSPTSPTSPSTPPTSEPETVERCPDPLSVAWLSEQGGPPLADGDPVVVVHGPQGGWHVGVNAGILGARRSTVVARASLERLATGEQLAGDDNTFALAVWGWEPETCGGTMTGMLAYVDDPPDVDQDYVCGLVGERLRLRLTIEDLEGTASHEAEVEVVAEADPSDPC